MTLVIIRVDNDNGSDDNDQGVIKFFIVHQITGHL